MSKSLQSMHFSLLSRIGIACLIGLALHLPFHATAQEDEPTRSEKSKLIDNMALKGYLKYLNNTFLPQSDSVELLTDNLLHNRFDYNWFLGDKLTFNLSARNRLFWGEVTRLTPNMKENLEQDPGLMDLSFVWTSGNAYALHTAIDRLNFNYASGNWEIIVGRHRINWGTGLVWNPNDIFNAFSFFDFDYEERPGADAILTRYYLNSTSSIELVYQVTERWEESALVPFYKFNAHGYDYQAFAGYQRGAFVGGLGWAGDIKGAGFRGEISTFGPSRTFSGNTQIVGGIDIDYTFTNSTYIHGAYLYNSEGLAGENGDYQGFFLNRELSAQTLSPSLHSIFGELGYQFSPFVRGGLFSMTNPNDWSVFVGPMVTWTISDNFETLLNGQVFSNEPNTAFGGYGTILYLRMKWNF